MRCFNRVIWTLIVPNWGVTKERKGAKRIDLKPNRRPVPNRNRNRNHNANPNPDLTLTLLIFAPFALFQLFFAPVRFLVTSENCFALT